MEKVYVSKSRESPLNVARFLNRWTSWTIPTYKVFFNDSFKMVWITELGCDKLLKSRYSWPILNKVPSKALEWKINIVSALQHNNTNYWENWFCCKKYSRVTFNKTYYVFVVKRKFFETQFCSASMGHWKKLLQISIHY